MLGTFNLGDYIPWLKWYKRVDGFNVRVEKLAKPLDEFLDGAVEEHRYKKKRKADGNDSTGEADHVDILLEIQRENKAGFPFGTDTMKAVIFLRTSLYFARSDFSNTVKIIWLEYNLFPCSKGHVCCWDWYNIYFLRVGSGRAFKAPENYGETAE